MEILTKDWNENEPDSQSESRPGAHSMTPVSRRDWMKASIGGAMGLAVGGLIDVAAVRAATRELKLSKVSEFTTSCNFCSCGCGMIAAVREGKLIAMEGDYDHIVNRGSLCVKGISMFAIHTSPNRLKRRKTPCCELSLKKRRSGLPRKVFPHFRSAAAADPPWFAADKQN